MTDACWLTIVGLGEDGPKGLSPASLEALEAADVVMGAARHLALVPEIGVERIEWPVPFADGLPILQELRGQNVVVLASGDPFWFGAGSVITRDLEPGEWRAFPGSSTFSLVAARLGWPLERTACLGLHAVPFDRLRPMIGVGKTAIVLLRDGDAPGLLAKWLTDEGFGKTTLHVFEAVGGPREQYRQTHAADYDLGKVQHPVAVALEFAGDGRVVGLTSGRADNLFDHDGQITKRPVRAVTLSTLAPRHGERLWDIGAGSGSIALEWLLSDPSTQGIAIEADPARAERVRQNALRLGVDRMQVVAGSAPEALAGLDTPDAVFVGGGLNRSMLDWLVRNLPAGTRLVANAVTLETEAVVLEAQARIGGALMKLELSEAAPLGSFRGWKASFPIVQWSVEL